MKIGCVNYFVVSHFWLDIPKQRMHKSFWEKNIQMMNFVSEYMHVDLSCTFIPALLFHKD